MEDNENSESQKDSHMEPVVTKVFEADNHYHFVCKSSTTKNDSEDMDAQEPRFKLKKVDTWLEKQTSLSK